MSQQFHPSEKKVNEIFSLLIFLLIQFPRKKSKSGRVVRYSAEQLKKKGVLTNLDSVGVEQHHNIEFEISPKDPSGRFCVKCRFMGVEVDRADIDIQVCAFLV